MLDRLTDHQVPPSPTPRLAWSAPHPTPQVIWKVTWWPGAGSLGGGLARLARLARSASLPPGPPFASHDTQATPLA